MLAGCNTPGGEQTVHSVLLTTPVQAHSGQDVNFSGIVREAGEINLGFKTAGQISRIAVDEGDFVRQGQLIATLDDTDYRLGVEALQVQYDQLSAEVKRLEQLYKGKSVSANDYEKAVAGLKQLGVQLQVNKNKLDYTRLCAPVSGYVRQVNFDEAEMVNAGTAVISLLDVDGMEVELDVPATVYQQREKITGIGCRTSDTGKEFPHEASEPDAQSRRHAALPHAHRFCLCPRRLADGRQECAGAPQPGARRPDTKLCPPPGFAFPRAGESYVWTVGKDSIINKVEVVLQGTNAEGRAVVSGLEGDEAVVRAGVHALRQGEKVRIIDETSETNVGGQL